MNTTMTAQMNDTLTQLTLLSQKPLSRDTLPAVLALLQVSDRDGDPEILPHAATLFADAMPTGSTLFARIPLGGEERVVCMPRIMPVPGTHRRTARGFWFAPTVAVVQDGYLCTVVATDQVFNLTKGGTGTVVRHNGYVHLLPGHPWYENACPSFVDDVSYGVDITYAEFGDRVGTSEPAWVLGFDTMHYYNTAEDQSLDGTFAVLCALAAQAAAAARG